MNIWIEILLIVVVGTAGNILFKIGTLGFGELSFSSFFTKEFFVKAFTSKFGWLIFGSLIINFAGRVLIMSPLSREKFGIVFNMLAPLSVIFTIIVGYLVFHETYTVRELIGVLLAIASVWLMGCG